MGDPAQLARCARHPALLADVSDAPSSGGAVLVSLGGGRPCRARTATGNTALIFPFFGSELFQGHRSHALRMFTESSLQLCQHRIEVFSVGGNGLFTQLPNAFFEGAWTHGIGCSQ